MRLFTALLSCSCLLFVAACDSQGSSTDPNSGTQASAKGGNQLDITLPDLDGDDVTLTAATDSDVFVLAFWATWCDPCQDELAKFQPMYEEMKSRGMQLFGIATDGPDTAPSVPTVARREGYTFPVLFDRESEILGRYNLGGDLPFYVVLDAQGAVIKSHQGYNPGDEEELRHFLEERLPAAQ